MKTQSVIDHITQWLKNYAENAGMRGFVVGVSGGVDSAVVSVLAARTGLHTLLLEMPIRQKADQVSRAQAHMAWVKAHFARVDTLRVDLTPTFETFEKQVQVSEAEFPNKNLALANSRSRLRMLTLYYYGQIHHLLVTGTGNKIEDFGVGFYTKYGDGGVDISPIADLTKTQVYEVAKALGVAQEILEAAPTDGLWDTDRTDAQQIGATYPELEWAMEQAKTHRAEEFSGREREVFDLYMRFHKAAQHKINPIPVCTIPESLLK